MRERRGTGRRLALTAAVLVAVGASFVHSDAASASSHSHAASASSRSDAASASSHSHAASESSHSDAASASAHSNAASASSRDRSFAVIKFWPSRNVVTLDIPSACPDSHPTCVWVLTVNEPETPAQTLVGTATGTSGVLTVAYPDDFCGVIQADATVGPAPWKIQFGHRAAIVAHPDARGRNCQDRTRAAAVHRDQSQTVDDRRAVPRPFGIQHSHHR
jgi:hypothetical protein